MVKAKKQKCSVCTVAKSLNCFIKGNNRLGLDSRCKSCEKLRRYNAYLKNFERESFFRLRARAKMGNIPFDLQVEDMPKRPSHCPILGVELVHNMGGGTQKCNSPSLDKVIPALGYIKGNIAWISTRANRLKSDANIQELQNIINYMEEYGKRNEQ